MTEIILFIVGMLVGVMNAIAGGGMLIGFPIMLGVGIPPIVANATTNIVTLPGNLAATYGYRKYLRKVPAKYLLLLIPVAVGGAIGATALKHTSPEKFEGLVPVLILIAVVLFAFQPLIYSQLHKHLHGPKQLQRAIKPLVIVGIAMLPVSIYGGFFGAGFGFIMLAFLSFTHLHEHMHRMNALKSVTTTCLALVSLLCLAGAGLIDWKHGLVMGAGSALGGYWGAHASQRVSSHTIRIVVVAIGFSAASYLAYKVYLPSQQI
ncbi:MAG: sulfite exporter TauE/SafE family protein [Candidatus Saccharimonadales bacterium]